MKGVFERDFVQKVVLYAQAQERKDLQLLRLRERKELQAKIHELEKELEIANGVKLWIKILFYPLRILSILTTSALICILIYIFIIQSIYILDAELAKELITICVLPQLDQIVEIYINYGQCGIYTPDFLNVMYDYFLKLASFYLEWRNL